VLVQNAGRTCSELRHDVTLLMKQLHAAQASAAAAHAPAPRAPLLYGEADEDHTASVADGAPSEQPDTAVAGAMERAMARQKRDGLSDEVVKRCQEQAAQLKAQQETVCS
jgi:hypothetical protein